VLRGGGGSGVAASEEEEEEEEEEETDACFKQSASTKMLPIYAFSIMEVRSVRKVGHVSMAANVGEIAATLPDSHICAVLLAEFDITTGSSLRAVYPPTFFSEAEIKQYTPQ
jgi:hypothetical protein